MKQQCKVIHLRHMHTRLYRGTRSHDQCHMRTTVVVVLTVGPSSNGVMDNLWGTPPPSPLLLVLLDILCSGITLPSKQPCDDFLGDRETLETRLLGEQDGVVSLLEPEVESILPWLCTAGDGSDIVQSSKLAIHHCRFNSHEDLLSLC